jgi:hypothetical protein
VGRGVFTIPLFPPSLMYYLSKIPWRICMNHSDHMSGICESSAFNGIGFNQLCWVLGSLNFSLLRLNNCWPSFHYMLGKSYAFLGKKGERICKNRSAYMRGSWDFLLRVSPKNHIPAPARWELWEVPPADTKNSAHRILMQHWYA